MCVKGNNVVSYENNSKTVSIQLVLYYTAITQVPVLQFFDCIVMILSVNLPGLPVPTEDSEYIFEIVQCQYPAAATPK